jgi:hypothetical protein
MYSLGDELRVIAVRKSKSEMPEETAVWNYMLEENHNY